MQNELGSCRLSRPQHFRKKVRRQKRTPETRACAQNPPSGVDPKQRKRAGTPRLRTESTFREPPKRCKKDAKNEFSTQIATTSAFRKLRTGVPPQRNPFFYPKNGFCMHFYTVWRRSKDNGKTRYKIHFLSSRKNIKYTVLFQKRQGRNPLTPFPPQRNAFLTSKIDFISIFARC